MTDIDLERLLNEHLQADEDPLPEAVYRLTDARVRQMPQRHWLGRIGSWSAMTATAAAAVLGVAVVASFVWGDVRPDPIGDRGSPSGGTILEIDETRVGRHDVTVIRGLPIRATAWPHTRPAIGVGAGSLWVGTGRGVGSITRIDPDSYEVLAVIDVTGAHPCGRISEAFGAIWSVHCWGANRIDPATNEVTAHVEGVSGLAVAATEEAVWSVRIEDVHDGCLCPLGQGRLISLDPASGELVGRFADERLWGHPIVVGAELWVLIPATPPADALPAAVARIDPESGEIVRHVAVEDAPVGQPIRAVASVDRIWLGLGSELVSVSTRGVAVTERYDVGGTITGLAVDDAGDIWVVTDGDLLRVRKGMGVIEQLGLSGLGSITSGFGSIWVTVLETDEVWRIDPG